MTHEDEDIRRLLTGAVPPLTPPQDRLGAVAARVRRRRQRVLGTSALAIALTVGMGIGAGRLLTGGDQAPPAAGPDRWTSCAVKDVEQETARKPFTASPPTPLPRLGDDFVPVSVIICDELPQQRSDGGTDLVARERHGDAEAALVAALRLPDEPRTSDWCTLDLVVPAWLAVVDAEGRWMRPAAPVDSCGKPRAEYSEALQATSLTTVSTRPIREMVSAGAAAAGCGQRIKHVIALADPPYPKGRRSVFRESFPGASPIRLCVYATPPGEWAEGEFVHGTVLSPTRRTAIDRALQEVGAPQPCTTRAGRFALLHSVASEGYFIYVELDGCHRVLADYGGTVLAQSDAALAALLDQP